MNDSDRLKQIKVYATPLRFLLGKKQIVILTLYNDEILSIGLVYNFGCKLKKWTNVLKRFGYCCNALSLRGFLCVCLWVGSNRQCQTLEAVCTLKCMYVCRPCWTTCGPPGGETGQLPEWAD